MADLVLARAAPLAPAPVPNLPAGLTVSATAPMARWIFRGDPAAASACGRAFGVALPLAVCRAEEDGPRAALWLGPDEWLLLAEDGAALTLDMGPPPHALVDVSHRQAGLVVEGRQAAELLNAGCPLPLDGAACPVGFCTRTVLGKVEIVLWRTGPHAYRIEVARSFAPYVAGFLAEAVAGLTA